MDNLRKQLNTLAKAIENSEKIALPVFAIKLAKASESYPEDTTIGMMHEVVARMAGTNKIFISRAEVKELYDRLYTRNTKFATLFSDELGTVETLKEPTFLNHEGEDLAGTAIQESYDKIIDPVLASGLASAFGDEAPCYSQHVAKQARHICSSLLESGVETASKVSVVDGNVNFILCSASFETPRGSTTMFIPVEVIDSKVLTPQVFIGNNGPEDFSFSNIASYVYDHAGEGVKIPKQHIVNALASINANEISAVDLAFTKLQAEKESLSELGPEFLESSNPNIVLDTSKFADSTVNSFAKKFASEIDTGKNVQYGEALNMPEFKDQEIESFAKSFTSELGIANFKFGKKVQAGRQMIGKMLDMFGQDNYTVAVASTDDSGVVYAISLNGGQNAIKVPMKLASDNIEVPAVFLANGTVNAFDKKSIQNFVSANLTDSRAAFASSPLYGLKASELVNIVRSAVEEQNYVKAEDAINILEQMNDEKAYETAIAVFTNGLNEEKTVVAEPNKCDRIVKSANSQHLLCGHLNLPLHKVHQDKHGQCVPSYRKDMDETYEGAYFMNSKIFF